ncbi:MAG: acetate--CoA ligase family protein [Deltaproteobacteria bacterium]|nr:acetate--CoA ligase family protein [Deltaproteobacteria bacterium]
MEPKEIIQAALNRGQTALSEYDSKRLLDAFGIPITREALAATEEEAAAFARKLGYPVVMKGCSPRLMHKSDQGWIELNVDSEDQVRRTFQRFVRKAEAPLDGVLIQEKILGPRELVIGMNRDPQFGVCVMLGLGGVMTEVFKDTVFRVAPFDLPEARDMTEELRSKDLLGPFRGQAPADIEALCRALTAVGTLGMELEAITELDANPVIIDPQGRIVAVDALVVLEG